MPFFDCFVFLFIFFSVIIFYTYFGYAVFLYIVVTIKHLFIKKDKVQAVQILPVTLIIPAYNESDFLEEKIKNTLNLDYSSAHLEIIVVTDGSNDNSGEVLKKYSDKISWLHQDERRGKAAAMNRAVQFAKNEILIFCDANTYLNTSAISEIVNQYADPLVGGVAGEKRIMLSGSDDIAGEGEGLYWKYESLVKKFESEFYSVIGAVGELMSFRKKLYQTLPEDTILDDFTQSIYITLQGYRVKYTKKAFASETGSLNPEEEWKRKVRIAAGGWQAIFRTYKALNPFHNFSLAFSYFSHKVLRWTLAPFSMIGLFVVNIPLAIVGGILYQVVMVGQLYFYVAAFVGYMFSKVGKKNQMTSIPFYFVLMNLSVVVGFYRFVSKSQKATWEKSKRAKI